MNFMGMGIMELAVIFLVSFLVLGPSKSIDMARTAGKVLRDLRRPNWSGGRFGRKRSRQVRG